MGVKAEKIGRMAVRVANSVVNFVILLAILLLMAFAAYALWDSQQLSEAASSRHYEVYKPTIEDEGQSFGELQAINSEVFGWLSVYGTNIDYPITQAENNWKYVNTDARGEYSLSGSIFLDYKNSPDFTDFNSVFYGHHMEKQTMFGEIGLFADKDYFEKRAYGNLYFNGMDNGLEFFAFLHVDAYDTTVFAPAIQGEEEQQEYLDNLLSRSIYTRDIGVTIADNIVLLSTCSASSTNGRDILVGRITKAVYEDGFISDAPVNVWSNLTVDAQGNETSVDALWVGLVLLTAVLIVIIVRLIQSKIRKSKSAGQ